jgi:antitoxin ParD1/3/4
MSKKLTIELPEELANYASAKVTAGEYASLDEAVAAGMRELKDNDDFIDRWVREEVIPSYEKWVADGKPTRSSDEVFADLEARIRERAARKAS